jgi:hypothetical protein
MTVRRDVLRAPFTLLLALDEEGLQGRGSLFSLPQHTDGHRPKHPILLESISSFGEAPGRRVAPNITRSGRPSRSREA